MRKIEWKLIWLALTLGISLTGCGGEPQAKETETPEPSETATQSQEPTPAATPSAQQEDKVEEPTPSASPVPTEEVPPPPPEPAPIVGLMPEGEPVEEEWFADAAFVGDSRTDGLRLYSGIKGASFFSYKGLSVFNIDDQECIPLDGERVTALDALSRKQYEKVFIMLGINELGYKDIEAFRQAYSDLVGAVKESQPEADIYIQLQPPVNETVAKRSGMSAHITNERVHLFNEQIVKVSEEHETALVDVWEALATEEGELPAEITNDGVHMKVSGYKVWYNYLRSHTGTTEPVPPEETEETEEPEEPVNTQAPEETPKPSETPTPSVSPEAAVTPTPSAEPEKKSET